MQLVNLVANALVIEKKPIPIVEIAPMI
jgi:hypothetical protein